MAKNLTIQITADYVLGDVISGMVILNRVVNTVEPRTPYDIYTFIWPLDEVKSTKQFQFDRYIVDEDLLGGKQVAQFIPADHDGIQLDDDQISILINKGGYVASIIQTDVKETNSYQ